MLLSTSTSCRRPSTATRCGRPAGGAGALSPRRLLGDPELPLADAARDLVADRTGRRPRAVRLLTMARTLGVGYNPVSFYYLYDGGETVQAMIAEVTNTPWGERHCCVITPWTGSAARWEDAEAHVSPFMPMEQTYEWSSGEPGSGWACGSPTASAELVFEASLAAAPPRAGRERR